MLFPSKNDQTAAHELLHSLDLPHSFAKKRQIPMRSALTKSKKRKPCWIIPTAFRKRVVRSEKGSELQLMKKTFLILIAQLSVISCFGQKNKNITHNSPTMQYCPVVTKYFEKFDSILYEQMKYEQMKKEGLNLGRVDKTLPAGTHLELGKTDNSAAFRETGKDSYFTLTKSY